MSKQHLFQDHPGVRAIQRMVEFAPSTGGLALWVGHQVHPAEVNAPLVTTDGKTLFYGHGFESLALAEQIGLVAHEVLHIALRHPQRFLELKSLLGDADLKLFNICADAIVNSALSHLSWLTLPRTAVYLDRLLAIALSLNQDVDKSLLEWDVERLYRAIDDRNLQRNNNGEDQDQQGAGKNASDQGALQSKSAEPRSDGPRSARIRALGANTPIDLVPTPDSDPPPEAEAEQARLWSERIERGHTGDGLHSMLRTLLADLPRVRTPWEQILRTHLARGLTTKPGISWSRPTRSYLANQGRCGSHGRLPWEPGFSTSKLIPRLVVIVDVSGSIEDDLLKSFALEIEAMIRRCEAQLIFVIGDDCVRQVVDFKPGFSNLHEITFNGRGGTDFTPLLLEANRHRPDMAVVLTDLDGPVRFHPKWPVIWAVPEAADNVIHPFGRKLVLC